MMEETGRLILAAKDGDHPGQRQRGMRERRGRRQPEQQPADAGQRLRHSRSGARSAGTSMTISLLTVDKGSTPN